MAATRRVAAMPAALALLALLAGSAASGASAASAMSGASTGSAMSVTSAASAMSVTSATSAASAMSTATAESTASAALDATDALERPRCRPNTACSETSATPDEFFYSVNDEQLIMEFKDTQHLLVWCNSEAAAASAAAADEPALPALPRRVTVDKVVFRNCLPPARAQGSYAAALAALNVTGARRLVLDRLPAAPALKRAHLAGLSLHALAITAADDDDPPRPHDDFLADAPGLRALTLNGVVLSAPALGWLPPALRSLALSDARLPAAEPGAPGWLARLPALRSLSLVEQGARAGRLAPPPLRALPGLTELYVHGGLAPPPPGWLYNSSLKILALNSCGLTELPGDMFQGVNLTSLSLSRNNLIDLPGGVFSRLRWLRSLDVSNNKLRGAALARTLPALRGLRELRASGNPLGSLCGGADVIRARERSILPRGLVRLELRATDATRVCADWLDDSALDYIDLQHNRIDYLTFAEVTMVRSGPAAGPARLLLGGNPLRLLNVTGADLQACSEPATRTRVPVELWLGALACDCRNARLRAALKYCAALLQARAAPCDTPPAALAGPPRADLMDYEPDELLCPYHEDCVPGCECGKRASDNATVVRCRGALPPDTRWPAAAARWPLALHVPGTGLRAVPRVALVELHAANNSISRLDAEDIPDTLRVLDVSYNSIAHISEAAALRLVQAPVAPPALLAPAAPPAPPKPRDVLLAGNPLICDCAHRAALVHLKSAKKLVEDWKVRCADLRPVRALDTRELCRSAMLPALLGALAALLLLLLAALLLRALRPRLKQALFDRGLCLAWVLGAADDADDPSKTHDAFVSYAYPDHALAAWLVRRLEARGHSTLEHGRDWLPGAAVSEHIARSVLCARRTLLLVSDHFASSKWALDEFRAAHAHALGPGAGAARVLLLRCGLRAPQRLPPDLQLYLKHNTYLSWDDPNFWTKLWGAMPTPRLAAEPEAVAPALADLPLSALALLAPPPPRAAPALKAPPAPEEEVPAAPPAAKKAPSAAKKAPPAAKKSPSAAKKAPPAAKKAPPAAKKAPPAAKKAPLPARVPLAPPAAPAAC